jgi:ComEC/Rec2-related protein
MIEYIKNILELDYHNLNLWNIVSFICGIIIFFHFTSLEEISYLIILSSIFILILIYYFKYEDIIWRFLILLCLFFSFGILVSKLKLSRITNEIMIQEEVISKIEASIESIRPTPYGYELILNNIYIYRLYQKLSKIKINISKKHTINELNVGDRISLLAKLYRPKTNLLPFTYDFGFYAKLAGISANGYAMSLVTILEISNIGKSFISKLRLKIYNYLIKNLGNINGNFAASIIIGEARGLDKDVMQDMRQSGISHILCVSGLHLTIVAGIVFLTCRFLLNISNYIAYNYDIKIISAICALIGSYLYLELSNMQIAATRAFIMTSIFIISIILGRKSEPMRSLSIAAFLILSINPEYVFHPSFQLSFICVVSLISGYEFYQKKQHIFANHRTIFGKFKLYIFSNIYSSFLASILTAPIVISQFYIFSTYSIPINLIVVPIMSFLLMPLAILCIIFMNFDFSIYILKLFGFFIEIIINIAHYANNLPGSVYYFGHITNISLLFFLFGFFWLSIWKTSIRSIGFIFMIIGVSLMFFSKKPTIIINNHDKYIGLKNKEGEIEIYTNNKYFSKFNRLYLANWYGQKDAKIYYMKDYTNKLINISEEYINSSKLILLYDK